MKISTGFQACVSVHTQLRTARERTTPVNSCDIFTFMSLKGGTALNPERTLSVWWLQLPHGHLATRASQACWGEELPLCKCSKWELWGTPPCAPEAPATWGETPITLITPDSPMYLQLPSYLYSLKVYDTDMVEAPEYYLILSVSGVEKYLPKSMISQPCVRPVQLCRGQWLLFHIPWGATAPVTSGPADTTKPWAKMAFLRLNGHTLKMLTHYKQVLH